MNLYLFTSIMILISIIALIGISIITSYFWIETNIKNITSIQRTDAIFDFNLKKKFVKITRIFNLDVINGVTQSRAYYLTLKEFIKEYEFDDNSLEFKNFLRKIINSTFSNKIVEQFNNLTKKNFNLYYSNETLISKKNIENQMELNKFIFLNLVKISDKGNNIYSTAVEFHSLDNMSWAIDHISLKKIDANSLTEFKKNIFETNPSSVLLFLFELTNNFIVKMKDFSLMENFLVNFVAEISKIENYSVIFTNDNNLYISISDPLFVYDEDQTIKFHKQELLKSFKENFIKYFTWPTEDIFNIFNSFKKIKSKNDIELLFINVITKQTFFKINNNKLFDDEKKYFAQKTKEINSLISKLNKNIQKSSLLVEFRKLRTEQGINFNEAFLTFEQDNDYKMINYSSLIGYSLMKSYITEVNSLSKRHLNQNINLITIELGFLKSFIEVFNSLNKNIFINLTFYDYNQTNFLISEKIIDDFNKLNISDRLVLTISNYQPWLINIIEILKPKKIILDREFSESLKYDQQNQIFLNELIENIEVYKGKLFILKK